MKGKFIWVYFILYLTKGYGHDAHVAFFEIQVVDSKSINIIVDFPWTLRDALLQYDSTLLNDKGAENWRKSFERYVLEHLSIYDVEYHPIKLLGIEVLPNSESSHSVRYKFQFEGGVISEIENRLMFNLNPNQVNYHTLKNKSDEIEFVTNAHSPKFQPKEIELVNYYFTILVIGSIFLSLLLRMTKLKIEKP